MGTYMDRKFGSLAITAASVAAFGIGAIASWLAFGAPRGIDLVADNGNTADWVSAVGTVVVGVAATWFAYEANRARERDAHAEDVRAKKEAFSRLWGLMEGGFAVGGPARVLSQMEKTDDPKEVTAWTSMLSSVVRTLRGARWRDEDRVLLGMEGRARLADLEYKVNSVIHLVEIATPMLQKDPIDTEMLSTLTGDFKVIGEELAEISTAFLDVVKAQLDALESAFATEHVQGRGRDKW